MKMKVKLNVNLNWIFRVVDIFICVLYGFTVWIAGFVTYIRCDPLIATKGFVYSLVLLAALIVAVIAFPKYIFFPTKMSPEDWAKFHRL